MSNNCKKGFTVEKIVNNKPQNALFLFVNKAFHFDKKSFNAS